MYKFSIALIAIILITSCMEQGENAKKAGEMLTRKQLLGKELFFDKNLSTPPGQACADCHAEESGFANPDKSIPVSRGVHPDRFGNRNDLVAAYASFSPDFHYDSTEGIYVGGSFWDGRAKNIVEQA
ncbi:MAG: cytochrome-c peroxidase, partial [bacterium]|nr:cytochrome-c peroxidase [bacterium]